MAVWNKAVCPICQKPIEKISDSFFQFGFLNGMHYFHALCHAKKTLADYKAISPTSAVGGGPGMASMHQTIKFYEDAVSDLENGDKQLGRKKIQNIFYSNPLYNVFVSALCAIILPFALFGIIYLLLTTHFDIVGYISFILLSLLILMGLAYYPIISYLLWQHEKQVEAELSGNSHLA